jgi:hypothetical protein
LAALELTDNEWDRVTLFLGVLAVNFFFYRKRVITDYFSSTPTMHNKDFHQMMGRPYISLFLLSKRSTMFGPRVPNDPNTHIWRQLSTPVLKRLLSTTIKPRIQMHLSLQCVSPAYTYKAFNPNR